MKATEVLAGAVTSVCVTAIAVPVVGAFCWNHFEYLFSSTYAASSPDERYGVCLGIHWWQPLADMAWLIIAPLVVFALAIFLVWLMPNSDETVGTILFIMITAAWFGFFICGGAGLPEGNMVNGSMPIPVITHVGAWVGCAVDHGHS